MSALIEQLHFSSPVVRAMLCLLPHLRPPVVLVPGPQAVQPAGWLQLPSMNLLLAGAAGPVDPAMVEADVVARGANSDVLVVSIRPDHHADAIRFDVIFTQDRQTEVVEDLLFWLHPGELPTLAPVAPCARGVAIGRSTLVPTDQMPYRDSGGRAEGLARGHAELRLAMWGEL